MKNAKAVSILTLIGSLIISVSILLYSPQIGTVSQNNENEQQIENKTINNNWNLILVNKKHPVDENFSVACDEISKGQYCDKRITPFLEDMLNAAKLDNEPLFISSSFRSLNRQHYLYNTSYQKNINLGFSPLDAKLKTEQYQAIPGTSEHITGLAFDIVSANWFNNHNDLTDDFEQTTAFKWLNDNAYKYGFILRYPKDKTDITGYGYEPWHYRYVGKDAASFIKEHNICLEEYLNVY